MDIFEQLAEQIRITDQKVAELQQVISQTFGLWVFILKQQTDEMKWTAIGATTIEPEAIAWQESSVKRRFRTERVLNATQSKGGITIGTRLHSKRPSPN